MEISMVTVLLLTLASSGFGAKQFFDDHGVSATQLAVFREAVGTKIPKKTRTGQVVTEQSLKNQYLALQEKLKKLPNTPSTQHIIEKVATDITTINAKDAADNLEKIAKVVAALEKNVGALSGKDTKAMAKAICDVLAAVSAFAPPPYGTIVSSILGIMSGIIGISQGKPKSMGEIVKEIVQNELQNQYNNQLQDEVQGAIKSLELTQVFLNRYSGKLTSDNFLFMSTQFNFLTRMDLLGKMMSNIKRLAGSKKKTDAENAIKLLDNYVIMYNLVEVLMHTMRSILAEDPNKMDSADALGDSIEYARAGNQNDLDFVRNPMQANGVFFLTYSQNPLPNLEIMLESLKATSSPVTVKPQTCYKMMNKNNDKGVKIKSIPVGFAEAAIFLLIKIGKSYMLKTTDGLVCGGSSPSSYFEFDTCSTAMPKGHIQLYPFANGGYMIMNDEWPKNPLWMKSISLFKNPSSKSLSISAEDKSWDQDNPEYVWMLPEVPCGKQ